MSSQSSGDHSREDSTPSESATPRPHLLPHTPLSALSSLVQPSHGTKQYQASALTKSLNRPIISGNPSLVAPPAHSTTSQALHHPARSTMEAGKPVVTTASVSVPQSVGAQQASAASSILGMSSSILRGAGSTTMTPFPAHGHLPKGAVAAASALASPKSAISTAVPILRQHLPAHQPATTLSSAQHTSIPRGQLITPNIHPVTPPQTLAPSAISMASLASQHSDPHRMGISMQTTCGPSTTPSIQITLQASRTSADPKQIHINPGTSNKVLMSQAAVPPIIQQHTGYAGTSLQKHSAVGPSLPTTGHLTSLSSALSSVPLSSVTTTASSTIPIAKVPPVRQQQPSSLAGHMPVTTASGLTSTADSSHTQADSSSRDTPSQPTPTVHLPPQSHVGPSQGSTPSSIFLSQGHGLNPLVSSSITNPDTRADRPNQNMYQMPCILPHEYHRLLYQQMAAAALSRPGQPLIPGAIQTPPAGITSAAAAAALRLNPMMVQSVAMSQQALPLHPPLTSASVITSTVSDGVNRSSIAGDSLVTISAVASSAEAIPVPALSAMAMQISAGAATASTLYSMSTAAPHPGSLTPQHSRPESNSTPVSTPNASPRPSILRKRTNEGNVPVKKPVCALNTMMERNTDRHSPRPDSRTDSAPQSNTSSPKTPATPAGESQSSTDTALSSEATTPTQNSDLKIKQEPPDLLENGFPTASSIASTLSASLPNSVEASPRKKPRKQLLHANEELKDNTSTDDEFEKIEDVKEEMPNEIKVEQRDEYIDDEGVRWTLEKTKPNISLLNFYNISWKSRNNHFHRYSDVKPKEERRPTVNELSNQKGIVQKASGWKLYHMAAQLEDLTELEKTLNSTVSMLQSSLAPRPPSKHSVMEDDMGMLHELTQGNIQRCQLITDQLEEAKTSMFKVLDHKQKIFEIINKHMSKRPIKKKERT